MTFYPRGTHRHPRDRSNTRAVRAGMTLSDALRALQGFVLRPLPLFFFFFFFFLLSFSFLAYSVLSVSSLLLQ